MSARDDAGIAAALDAFECVLDEPRSEAAERAAARTTVLDAIDAYKAQRTGIGGRPTKCDDATMAAIVEQVANGVRVTTAGEAVGVSARSVSRWMNADEDDEEAGEFRRRVTQARAQWRASRVKIVNTAQVAVGRDSEGASVLADDPKYSLALLERDAPEDYAPSMTILHKAKDDAVHAAIEALRSGLTGAEFARVLEVLRADDGEEQRADH